MFKEDKHVIFNVKNVTKWIKEYLRLKKKKNNKTFWGNLTEKNTSILKPFFTMIYEVSFI